jgi:hypothetical protein
MGLPNESEYHEDIELAIIIDLLLRINYELSIPKLSSSYIVNIIF